MTVTLLEILRQYAYNGSLNTEYVTVAEYEALKTLITEAQSVINSHNTLISTRQAYEALGKEYEAVLRLLRQWAEIGPFLQTRTSMAHAHKLDQLRIDTKAAFDAQPGNNPGTSGSAD
jgi:predicted kinase